jgi:TM2 domain-containing membrane protein YozV
MTPQSTPQTPEAADAEIHFQGVAALLAIVLPGLGHFYLGENRRGMYVALGVLGLFFGGMLIGGIDVVDRQEDSIWFLGEALVGPVAFGVDWVHQNEFKVLDGQVRRSAQPGERRDPATGAPVPAGPGQGPPNIKSLGRVNELGTLYCTIAGMLNLICIIDAAFRPSRRGGDA